MVVKFDPVIQTAFSVLGAAITFYAYGLMIQQTWARKVRPHPGSWYGFGILTGVGFCVQVQTGAGVGSSVLGVTCIACIFVGAISHRKGHWRLVDFSFWDWIALALGGGCALFYALWYEFSYGPIASAIWATLGDYILYYPILRNAWDRPQDEYVRGYGLNAVKFVPSFFAMNIWYWETCLYPLALLFMNAAVVFYLNWRRKENGLDATI